MAHLRSRLSTTLALAPLLGLSLVDALSGNADRQPRATAAAASFPARGDEFVGPFPSWVDIKARYGAVGDGTADDTDAWQKGLTDLGAPGRPPVLFVPAGTYRITRPLVLSFTINVSIVGEEPARTRLVWDGPEGGTMLQINGVAYSRFVRMTFDGRRRASIAVDQSYDNSKPHFDTGNEYGDDVFVDVEYGIRGGFKGYGFAETSVVRSRFIRNTRAGIALGNFNALDLWVWYSAFEDCALGVTNTTGAGNFHVYSSVFRGSTTADLSIGHTGGFSVRDSYSVGSRAFFVGGFTANPATIDLQGNTILDPAEAVAVRMGNQGPALLLDNTIRSRSSTAGPVVEWASFPSADVMSVGNTFSVTSAVRSNGRLTTVDDRFISRAQLNPAIPPLPDTPPNVRRPIFDVPPGSDADGIQRAIDAAAERIGERPIVHVPYGTYAVARTLVLPAGDLQLTGDGYRTVLQWAGTGRGPVVRAAGPSRSTLREIQIDGTGQADGLVIEDADQAGSRVYAQQAQLRSGRESDLFVDALDQTHVQLEDFGNTYSPEAASIRVVGGPSAAAGRATPGRTTILSGASAGNRISYDVSGGARVLVRDLWYESGAGSGFAHVHDRATFTAHGVRVSSPVDGAVPAFNLVNLSGAVALLSADLDDRITMSGNGRDARVLGVGIVCRRPFAGCFVNKTSPAAKAVVLNAREPASMLGVRSVGAANVGDAGESAFVRMMLEHTRSERTSVLQALPRGVTDVRLFRVWLASGRNNLTITRRTSAGR